MNLGTREDIINLISNSGSTLCDLAATYGSTPEAIAKQLGEMSIPLPSMSVEGPFDFIKNLRKGTRNSLPALDLMKDPFGGIQHLPQGKRGELIPNPRLIYQAAHGDRFIDPYSGQEVAAENLRYVDGNSKNYLVTNLEAVSPATWEARFNHPIGLARETFHLTTRQFLIDIEIERKYDQLVAGTYAPDYIHHLTCSWVCYPLNLYLKRNPEDDVMFTNVTPTSIAWWVWSQLSYYAHLKGIASIKVTSLDVLSMEQFSGNKMPVKNLSPATLQQSACLKASDVLEAVDRIVLHSLANAVRPSCTEVDLSPTLS